MAVATRFTWVCASCSAGWWNDQPADWCPYCGQAAERRGPVVLVVPLRRP